MDYNYPWARGFWQTGWPASLQLESGRKIAQGGLQTVWRWTLADLATSLDQQPDELALLVGVADPRMLAQLCRSMIALAVPIRLPSAGTCGRHA